MYIGVRVKYPLLLSHFNETNVFDRFFKNTEMSNITKICVLGAELFHSGRQTDGQT
jgi:hypothetical protein